MSSKSSRRDFLKQVSIGGAAVLPFAHAPHIIRRGANEKLNIAFIGVGGIGGAHTKSMARLGENCTAYAEVDLGRMGNAKKRWPNAKAYQDYREMFDKEHKNIDAVMIGTPDHHHFPATVIAMQLGKHVYTQKPLTHTVWEARQLSKLAAKYPSLATQMGNQGHGGEGWRTVVAWVKSGQLGTIKEVHTWTNRPVWPQGIKRPKGNDEVPNHLNWDVWLGPAKERPFKKGAYHSFSWRGWWDFGAGALGDMACHTMDGVFWALDPGYPTRVELVSATPVNKETFPSSSHIKWTFAAKGDRPAFVANWYDGGLRPPRPREFEAGRRLPNTGNLFVGTKATLLVSGDYGGNPRIIPETRAREMGQPERVIAKSIGHYKEWVQACRGEGRTMSNFAYAGPMTETILLGNVSLIAQHPLDWDGENLRFTNDDAANELITKDYRSGWKML